ncbi:MAG: Uncharacterised protein [Flavobacteriia bacterium]|nr:MAG: Uncharacterised protein [Flavobacteriia bacterium]
MRRKFCPGHFLRIRRSIHIRQLTPVVFVGEDEDPIQEISKNGHQFAVVALLKILPGKVVVFGLRRRCTKHITQHILLSGEIFEVFVQPDRPIAGGADLLAFEVQELVGRNRFGQVVRSMRHEHGRKDNAMENDVVLANEMHQAGIWILPIGAPLIGHQFLTG